MKQAFRVCFSCICIIFSCACFFSLVEDIPFHTSLYFMCIITMGRPPIPILDVPGTLVTFLVVTLSCILLPKQVQHLPNPTDETPNRHEPSMSCVCVSLLVGGSRESVVCEQQYRNGVH